MRVLVADRLSESSLDEMRTLGVEVSYILAPIPGENRWKFSADLRELLRLEEIAEKLEAEAMELHREF